MGKFGAALPDLRVNPVSDACLLDHGDWHFRPPAQRSVFASGGGFGWGGDATERGGSLTCGVCGAHCDINLTHRWVMSTEKMQGNKIIYSANIGIEGTDTAAGGDRK
jgi:hypothetical protein